MFSRWNWHNLKRWFWLWGTRDGFIYAMEQGRREYREAYQRLEERNEGR